MKKTTKALVGAVAAFGLVLGSAMSANAANVLLGSKSCSSPAAPYVHISSQHSWGQIGHTHRRTSTSFNTFTYMNGASTLRYSSMNWTSESSSSLNLASGNLSSYSIGCDS